MVVRSPSCCSTSTLAWRENAFWRLAIHRRQVGQRDRRNSRAQDVREDRRTCLRRREADGVLLQRRDVRRVAGRHQRIGQCPQRDAIVEQRRRCARTRVLRDSNGDHATPTRGEMLSASTSIVSSHCRS